MSNEIMRERFWIAYNSKVKLFNDFVDCFHLTPCAVVALNAVIEAAIDLTKVESEMEVANI